MRLALDMHAPFCDLYPTLRAHTHPPTTPTHVLHLQVLKLMTAFTVQLCLTHSSQPMTGFAGPAFGQLVTDLLLASLARDVCQCTIIASAIQVCEYKSH